MNLSAVLDAVASAVDADSEASAYVAATWPGKPLKVFVDIDRDAPPREAECPMVQIVSEDRFRSEDYVTMEHAVIVGVFVLGAGRVNPSGTHIYKQDGRAKCEGLARLVERTVSRALWGIDLPFDQFSPEPDQVWPSGKAFGVYYGFNVRIHDPIE